MVNPDSCMCGSTLFFERVEEVYDELWTDLWFKHHWMQTQARHKLDEKKDGEHLGV